MTKLSKKVLSILCVIALLVSGIAMAFAEEADEAPVWDETQQWEAEAEAARIAEEEAEAARIAAEEAEAARIAAEEEAARIAAEEEAARIAAEEAEAARIAAEEAEAARKAAEEEEARRAAEEAEAARKAAEEEEARRAAEEAEAARKAAEEEEARRAAEEAEAARKAAEEEEARKAAEEEEARKAAEEEEARKAAEEEEARKAAEEEEARKAAEEEEAQKATEEQVAEEPAPQEAAAAESSNNEAVAENAADANGNYEVIEGWGYVDPDVISEKTPEITDTFKGLRSATMGVNEILTDTLSFGDELVITLKCGDATTVELKLYSTDNVNVKVDDKAVAFTPADSDDTAYSMSTYVLENTAGRTHTISLSASDKVSIKLAAVAEQTEVQDMTPGTEEAAPAEEKNEETTPSEDINEGNTEIGEYTENDNNNENIETTENTETNETENIGNTDDDQDDNNNSDIIIESIEPTIQVSMKTYDALKVGNSISDSLVGGQKAKILVKCGKNLNVRLVLTSNPDDINVDIEGSDLAFTREADGVYAIELENVPFRKFNIVLSAKQDLDFTLSAESAGEAEAEGEEEEENKEENTEAINKEETEPAEENTEENPEALTGETEESENTEETEKTEEETTEGSEGETEGEETEAVEENTEENEKMTALGCTKVTVTAEEGADLYAEASKESEVVGHLDAGSEIWVTLNEDQTFGQFYSEDEEATAQYISMDDAAVKVEEAVEEETEEETEEQTEEEKMTVLGCTKVTVTAEEGADLYAEASKESEVVGHLDAGTEIWVTLNEDQTFGQLYSENEEAAVQYISMDDAAIKDEEIAEEETEEEKMTALGCTKVTVTTEAGADLYAEASKESEVVGHLDVGTEIWVTLNEDQTFGQLYSEDEEAVAQFISMEDAEVKKESEEKLTDEQMEELGYQKYSVIAEAGADVFESTEAEAEAVDHINAGTEFWAKPAEEEGWISLYTSEKGATAKFVKLSDLTGEIIPVEEIWYARNDMSVQMIDETGNLDQEHSAYAVSSMDNMSFIPEGTNVTIKINVDNISDNETCAYQWFTSQDGGTTWQQIEGADLDRYSYIFSYETWKCAWRAVVTITKK